MVNKILILIFTILVVSCTSVDPVSPTVGSAIAFSSPSPSPSPTGSPTSTITCSESDGGDDPNTAGVATTRDDQGTEITLDDHLELFADECEGREKVLEHNCDEEGVYVVEHECGLGEFCVAGRCRTSFCESDSDCRLESACDTKTIGDDLVYGYYPRYFTCENNECVAPEHTGDFQPCGITELTVREDAFGNCYCK